MNTPAASTRRGRATGPVVIAVTGTLGLAAAAFVLSFTALRDLAILAGIPSEQAWLWPLVVDGVILEATISVVALRDGTPAARRFAWLLLISGAGISVAANITHALVIADERVPALIAAFVASVPPLTLVAMTHLTVELIRNTTPTAATSHQHHAIDAPLGITEINQQRELAGPGPEIETTPDHETTARVSSEAEPATKQARQQQRALAIALATDPAQQLSFRQIADRVGVHPTTVGRWVSAPEGQPPEPDGQAADGRNVDEPDI